MVEFTAKAIVEIAGSPKEFIEKTMGLLLEEMEKDEEFKLVSKETEEAVKSDKIFSTFSEVICEFKDYTSLIHFCFKYLPSNFEIEKPARIELRREELVDTINDLLMNLHKMDQVVKDVRMRHKLVEDANKMLLKNSLAMALSDGPKTSEEITKLTGIHQPNLDSILVFYEDKGLLIKKKNKYELK